MRTIYENYDEKENCYYVNLAMPGIKKEDIRVETEDDGAIIKHVGDDNPFLVNRVITIGFSGRKVDVSKFGAELKDGILKVAIPLKSKNTVAVR